MEKLNSQTSISNLENQFLKKDLPVLKIGDNVKVGVKIIEGNKERVQFYQGIIIARKKYNNKYDNNCSKNFTRHWDRKNLFTSLTKNRLDYCSTFSKGS